MGVLDPRLAFHEILSISARRRIARVVLFKYRAIVRASLPERIRVLSNASSDSGQALPDLDLNPMICSGFLYVRIPKALIEIYKTSGPSEVSITL